MKKEAKQLIEELITFITCDSDNTVDPTSETLTGFWQAKEIAQHFWLDDIVPDSVSGFGQLGKVNNLGILEWIPLTVEGNIIESDIILLISISDTTTFFKGEIISAYTMRGNWQYTSDTILVTYNKRIEY